MSKMSREDAIRSLELSLGTYEALEIGEEELKMAIEALKEQRPHGEWIWKKWVNFNLSGDIICSECNFVYFEGASKERMKAKLYPFCPNCGADMRKEGDAE